MTGLVQAYCPPPQLAISTVLVTAMARVVMPHVSSWTLVGFDGSRVPQMAAARAIRPSGMFSHRPHRQLWWSVSQPAQERTDHGGQSEHRAHRGGALGPLPGRHQDGDDRLGGDHQPAATEALHGTARDQPAHRGRTAGDDGPGDEHRDTDDEDPLVAEQVPSLP